MKAVGIKILKNKLSEYVRLAAGGEVVLVTDHDRVVAELTAPGTHRSESVQESLLSEAIRLGNITPATGRHLPLDFPPPVATHQEIVDDLSQSREDRWSS